MAYLTSSYDPWVVAASIMVASFASYVTLDLTKRVRTQERGVALAWWIGGSIAMGTGIWSMHFIGMLAYSLPIDLGYTKALTFLSWVAAVVVSAVALAIASRGALTWQRLAGGSLAMGAGICCMHYIGMAALDMSPGIVWDRTLVAASAVIAVVASGAALLIFFWLQRVNGGRGLLFQTAAALVMGLAISGMHYTGMAAASFPFGSVCLSAASLGGDSLQTLVLMASVTLLTLTLCTSMVDGRMQNKAKRLATSLEMSNARLQAANAELNKRALLDPLTGVANRLLFEDRLMHAASRLARARKGKAGGEGEMLAVLFIDLDAFKPVNDSLGHAAGDLVLKETAQRLCRAARETDTVARVGGDEFVLLMEDVASLDDCVATAERLIEAIRLPFDVSTRQVQISCSVGISVYPEHGRAKKLVARADAAMYSAKRAGRGTYAVFEERMDKGALDDLTLLNDLRDAIRLGQLSLHYQPKISGCDGRISGVEALLRWDHPERGRIMPGTFIPVAERFGLINSLGDWVIQEACRQMRVWIGEGLRMRVAINLSVHQLQHGDLVARIQRSLARHQVEASQLLCEITETVAMEDIKATQRTFAGLRRIGVYLSIDDFGTGYSSLSYLRRLPAQQLKIDKSFVKDLDTDSDARAVVDAVIRLAHALALDVVAEGVESAEHREVLLKLGCDELQGYFFAEPMPADALLAWANQHKPSNVVDFSPRRRQA